MRLAPENLELVGDTLAIRWNDESETYIRLEDLRRSCPCAMCQGEPDVRGRRVQPQKTLTPQSFELRRYDLVGGYALQPVWADGHNTGLFSYRYLRDLPRTGERS